VKNINEVSNPDFSDAEADSDKDSDHIDPPKQICDSTSSVIYRDYRVKIVSKVNNLGFVLNERITATDHLRKVYVRRFIGFFDHMLLIRHLRSEEGLCCRLSCPMRGKSNT
jgi:hypothetical protein